MQKSHSVQGKRGDKKLSWAYRNKKRISKNKKRDEENEDSLSANVQVQNKKARIVLRNLPFKVTEDDIREHYSPYGDIEEINLLRHPGGKLVGCGFVQFKKVEQASKAIFNTNKKELLGRVITSDWAIPKYKFSEGGGGGGGGGKDGENNNEEITTVAENDGERLEEGEAKEEEEVTTNNEKPTPSKNQLKKETKKKERREKDRQRNVQKRARLIVRNLSFNITEDELRAHFSPFGSVEEVKILSRPDGKLVGCGFIQYTFVQSAAKAIHHLNLKPLLGRPIIVDWAVPKTKFGKNEEQSNVAGEINFDEIEIKEEKPDEDDENTRDDVVADDVSVKSEEEGEDKPEIEESDEEKHDMESLAEDSEKDDEEDEDDKAELNDEKDEKFDVEEASRPRRVSNDVNEGKTVFLKNVPFSATNEELRQCMEQFGPVYYALICMDHLTEHSKGTAFVKFRNLEDAEKCLSAGTELRLHDQVLDPHKALNRNDVQDKSQLKKQKVTDSRNLYLVKEGVILAGSPAAVGVSAGDMARRLQLEQWKSQMLRNLNMFVSRVRLVVHNLPVSVDDNKLREIFKNNSGPKAVIRESRVMRDLRNIEANGIGRSKEYGFVAFTSHEDALMALRNINNNPKIFGPLKRPIVAFSIENRVMVNAIKKRVEKSRERNPLWIEKNKKNTDEKSPGIKRKNNDNRLPDRKRRKNVSDNLTTNHQTNKNFQRAAKNSRFNNTDGEDRVRSYSGVESKPGEGKMRSRFNLKSQAILHRQNLKEEFKTKKTRAKIQVQRNADKISRKERVRPKQGTKKVSKDEVNFSKLVNNYKNKLLATPQTKSKWYET